MLSCQPFLTVKLEGKKGRARWVLIVMKKALLALLAWLVRLAWLAGLVCLFWLIYYYAIMLTLL